MEFIEQVIALFGYSPDTKELSAFLDEHNIRERPEYDPNDGTPMIWIEKKDQGYILQFGMASDFKDHRGPTFGVGAMVLEGVRLHGSLNSNGYAAFKEKLPFGLNFGLNADEIINELGQPDFVSAPEKPKRIMQWKNVNNFEVGIMLTSDFKYMNYLDVWPSRR